MNKSALNLLLETRPWSVQNKTKQVFLQLFVCDKDPKSGTIKQRWSPKSYSKQCGESKGGRLVIMYKYPYLCVLFCKVCRNKQENRRGRTAVQSERHFNGVP